VAIVNNPVDQSLARQTGLFLVLLVLVNGLILPGAHSVKELMATFYLALFIHVGFTIYDGRFNALRTATWLLLISLWVGSEIAAFFGLVFPSGQFAFWLTNVPLVGEALAAWFTGDSTATHEAPMLWPALLLVVLGLDIAIMHYDDWRQRSLLQTALFLAIVAVAAIVLGVALSAGMGRSAPNGFDAGASPFPIVPPWHLLPFYALLRAVPSKLGGVILMFAAMLVPMIWPWQRADLLRLGPTGRVWSLLCLALAAAWVGLGYLGSRPADGASEHAAQALAVFCFAFFLVVPPVLGKIAGRVAT
jgi:ubiquinol-cytochrome c reductase cytochrome b/c1 subunit